MHALAPDEIKAWVRNWIQNKTRCNYLSLPWSNLNYIGKRIHGQLRSVGNIFASVDRFAMVKKMLQTC